jgi:thiol:disulfide interchange protein
MRRAVSIVVAVAMIGLAVCVLWPHLPRAIGVTLVVIAFVAVCMQLAFRLHDTDQAGKDTSLRG